MNYAYYMIEMENYNKAIRITKKVLTETSETPYAHYALNLLWKASRNTDIPGFKNFLNIAVENIPLSNLSSSMETILLGYEGTPQTIVQSYGNLVSTYEGNQAQEKILFDKFMYHFMEKENFETAQTVYNKLNQNFPNSKSTEDAQFLLTGINDSDGDKLNKKGSSKEDDKNSGEISNIPKEYKLIGNYPNPFNPRTNIRYGLPSNSRVELTIYNINGRKIKSYFMDSQNPGYHTITWDGRNEHGSKVASGIYLYRIKAVSLEENKNFVTSAKLLLLK